MNKNKLIIIIVCCVVLLAALCVVAVGLTAGWWTNGNATGETGIPTDSQHTGNPDDTAVPGTTGVADPTDSTIPTLIIGVDTGDEEEDMGNDGSSGNGSNMIDFDDLLKPSGGNSNTEQKPTEPKPTDPKPTDPKPTEPETTEPPATQPEEDEGGGAIEKEEDIDVPLG